MVNGSPPIHRPCARPLDACYRRDARRGLITWRRGSPLREPIHLIFLSRLSLCHNDLPSPSARRFPLRVPSSFFVLLFYSSPHIPPNRELPQPFLLFFWQSPKDSLSLILSIQQQVHAHPERILNSFFI